MAIIKYLHASDIRGKLNGTVFSRNTYGQYMRNKVTPVNPKTNSQNTVRSNFGSEAQRWRGLTEAQRASWIAAAVNFLTTNTFGDSFKYTGFNLFIKVNRILQAIGAAVVSVPPVPAAVTNNAITALAAAAGAGTVTVTYSPVITADHTVIVKATPPVSAGKTFVESEFRQIRTLTEIVGDVSPVNVGAAYVTKFGSLTGKAGMKIFVRLVPILETGIVGVTSQQSTIIIA